MGMRTQLAIEEWQRRAGLEEAQGGRRELLDKLSKAAYELIKFIELEKSGIRDGNGCWHADVVSAELGGVAELCRELLADYEREAFVPGDCDYPF